MAVSCANEVASSQVNRELGELSEAIHSLDEMLMRLGDKIACVLVDEGKGCEDPSCPQPMLVPLADQIRVNRQRIVNLRDRVQSQVNRIELLSCPGDTHALHPNPLGLHLPLVPGLHQRCLVVAPMTMRQFPSPPPPRPSPSRTKKDAEEAIRSDERDRLWMELKRYWKGGMGPAYIIAKEVEHLFKPTPE